MISREQALEAVKQHLTNKNLQKHVLAVEAVMRAMAEHYGEDAERWGMKRFGEKAFARGANRDIIRACSDFGMEMDEFITIGIRAMQSISEELGL